uniref:Retrovirus-related Pol polyprotein from transposon TNT 1-94 n=1 Tax=Tanacetum cinerariifolium TaxID=118510 RepID=A0A6L2LPU2_TANCI|nr:hypothetical protein [Tanacetum cinerariifolium]
MDTKIDQQVAMDEALEHHAQRIRIRRSNFRLLSDIKSKESTLQLVYDTTATVHQHVIRFKMDTKKHIVNLESFRDMLHICLRVYGQSYVEPPFEEEILAFIHFLGHSAAIKKLTDVNINKLYQPWRSFASIINKCLTGKSSGFDSLRLSQAQILNSNDYKEYYAVAIGAAPPKPKASVRKTRSSSDTTIIPLTTAAGPRLTTSTKGKQAAKASKAKSLSALSEEAKRDDEKDDEEEGGDDEQEFDEEEYDEETRDKESFDPIPKTPENSDDEGNGVEDLDLNVGREERHDEEEEEDELYIDININQEKGIQATLEVKDSHVTLTPVNPDDQWMNEAVKVAVQIQFDCLRDEAQKENDKDGVKKILIKKIKGNKYIQCSDDQRNLYKALVEAYEADKIIFDTFRETITLKRRRDDDADKDEEPSAGPDRGSTQGSKSRLMSTSESATAEEPMQTTFEMEEPAHLGFETGADDQPIVESSQHPEWFSQQQKPPNPDRDWNKTLPAIHESIQPWIIILAKQSDSRSFFNELMDAPLDFSNFLINRLKVDILTPELIAGLTYELLKGSCKSLVELEYHLEEVYKARTDQLDWAMTSIPLGSLPLGRKHQQFYGFAVNRESARDVYSKDDDKLYKFKEDDFKRLRIQDIEDIFLLFVQGKLTNLTVEERFALNVYLQMFTRSIVIQRRVKDLQLGNKDKKNRLMRIDELHKFNDGTLTDVRTALDDRLKGIRMQYLPQSIWRKSDNDRATAMIQAIDKRLKTRRIMRSLKRFVGGRLYEGDFRMLQRTI